MQRINATQSGLSMQARDLEGRYGAALLTRGSTGVQPLGEAAKAFATMLREDLDLTLTWNAVHTA